MKPCTCAVVPCCLVKLFSQNVSVFSASRVGPTKNFCCRFARCIDADEAVPERTGRDVFYIAFYFCSFFLNRVNDCGNLGKSFVSVHLGAAIAGYD